MMPGGGGGAMGGGMPGVAPTASCRALAQQMRTILLAMLVCVAACVVLAVEARRIRIGLWPFIQLIGMGFGYCSIRNDDAYIPPMMQSFCLFNFFGSMIGLIFTLQAFLFPDWFAAIVLLPCINVFFFATRHSWLLFKEMMGCEPTVALPFFDTAAAGQGGAGGGGVGGFLTGGGREPLGGVAPNSSSNNNPGFVPFQGEGRQLNS